MNEEKLEFLIRNKYSEELMRHGIIHTKGFKDSVIYCYIIKDMHKIFFTDYLKRMDILKILFLILMK